MTLPAATVRGDDSMRETIEGHVFQVCNDLDEWPTEWPDFIPDGLPNAIGAWAYVEGYANALDLTATELLDALDIDLAKLKEADHG